MKSSWLQLTLVFIIILFHELFDIDRVEELDISVTEVPILYVVGVFYNFKEALWLSVLPRNHLSCHVFLLKKPVIGNMYWDNDQIF